jgi:leader peptidase (prepilin peptidase)/N-methyltransferase
MNIPILSFNFLKGRCAFCSVKISIQYPLVELSCALLFLLFFDVSRPFATAGLCLALCFLLAVAVIDFRHFIIHHALLAAAIICFLPTVIFQDFVWQYHLAGMLFCPGFIWLVSRSVKLVNKRENLGAGDVLLGIVIGFYLGPYLSMIMYSIASVLGIVYWLIASKSKQDDKEPVQIPFGTGMVAGLVLLEILFLPPFISYFKFLKLIIFTDGFVAEMLSLL